MKIGLGLMVRNEEIDIFRCLDTFLPQVDCCCIIDTGSLDRTLEIAQDALNKHSKDYHISQFLDCNADAKFGPIADFSCGRNEYVKILRDKMDCDYIFSVDADDSYVGPDNLKDFIKNNPNSIYNIKYHLNDDVHIMAFKIWDCRNNSDIKYVGRVHETLTFDWKNVTILNTPEIAIRHHPGTYNGQEHGTKRNLRILRSEIYPSLRSIFYWANENVDDGNYHEAIKWYVEYIRRAKAGEDVWPIELAHCYFRAARWLQYLNKTDEAIALSKELLSWDPSWSESWCELAYIASLKKDYKSMREYATQAKQNVFQDRLFSEIDKYTTVPANMLIFCDMIEKSAAIVAEHVKAQPTV